MAGLAKKKWLGVWSQRTSLHQKAQSWNMENMLKKRILVLLSKQLLILYFSQETFTTASFTWLYLLPFHIRVISRANYLMVGTQNQKCPNRDMEKKFKITKQLVQTQYIQGNWSWKKNKKNKPTNQSANKSLFVQNLRSLFIAVPPAIVMWTR